MPCGSIACASWRSAATLLEPLDHQGLLDGAAARSGAGRRRARRRCACWRSLGSRPKRRDITELRHVRSSAEKRAAEEIANRERCEDFDDVQAAVRAGPEGTGHGHSRNPPVRAEGRDRAGPLLHRRRPEGLRRRDGRDVHAATRATRMRACASSSTTAPRATCSCARLQRALEQGRGRPADHRADRRAAVRRSDRRRRRGERHDLCAAQQVRSSARRREPRPGPQDRRDQRERRAAHRQCASSTRPS